MYVISLSTDKELCQQKSLPQELFKYSWSQNFSYFFHSIT